MQSYKFYMQEVAWYNGGYQDKEVNDDGTLSETVFEIKDLEEDFEGLKYIKCEGLEDVGEANVYTEVFADSDRLRVYVPENVTHKATEVKLTLIFVGENRRSTFNNFNEYIQQGFHAYWDSARKKRFVFFVKDAIKPSEDKFIGSTPYIEATYTLSNIKGKTETATSV